MLSLMNITIVSTWKTSTPQVLCYFNNTLKVFFIIRTCLTWFHVNLILHPLHFVIQQFSHMKLSYLLLEIKLFLIYWMRKILQSLMSLIQYQLHHPVINFQHRLRKMFGSLLSMDNTPSQLKARSMNSSAIILNVENTRPTSVYQEGISNRGQILKRFVPYLIKSDLWFHILRFVSHRNLSPQITWVKI